jgi:RimJ/RimL family protein N-acetyltransferase
MTPPDWAARRAAADAVVRGAFQMPREIRTERLWLAPFGFHHLPVMARFFADAASTRFVGGPRGLRGTLETMARFSGQWLLHGFGVYALTDADGALAGYAGLWFPHDKPELEITYGMLPEARGRGLAAEAVRAIRAEAEQNGAPSLVSYIDPANEPSQRVARAAGAAPSGERVRFGTVDAEVFRYPVTPGPLRAADDAEILLEAAAMPLSIRTPRLVLRQLHPDDFPRFAAHAADAETMRFIGGVKDLGTASRIFIGFAGQWFLRSYGFYAVEHEGRFSGCVGLYHPAEWPEAELAYNITRDAWGRGLAAEAATAVRDVAAAQGRRRLVSYIDPENAASLAVARRLGATEDGTAFVGGDSCLVWSHRMHATDPVPELV